jgi:hypothetical protein
MKTNEWDDVGVKSKYPAFAVEWDTLGAAAVAPIPQAPSNKFLYEAPPATGPHAAPGLLDRKIAQWALDHKMNCKVEIDGEKIPRKPGDPLPSENFAFAGFELSSKVSLTHDELAAITSDFRKLTKVGFSFLPIADCDVWAETFAAMPTIASVNAAGCEELTDIGAVHLARMPGLEYINLGGSPKITGKGLAAFAKCTRLRQIEICPEGMAAGSYTLADVQKLQDALPKTNVLFTRNKPIPGLKRAGR